MTAGNQRSAPASATDSGRSCCVPARRDGVSARRAVPPSAVGLGAHGVEQVHIPGGPLAMGDHHGDGKTEDGETPVHTVQVSPFVIDATCVTNDDFAAFAAATGYRTESERFGLSAVFHLAVHARRSDVLGRSGEAPWWLGVRGADWAHPGGLLSDVDGLGDHPVVHVSWNDALAYCEWTGRRLPTEAEWELAARGGLVGARYPWGDELGPEWECNIWQGDFPHQNTGEDGYLTTAPVRTYRPNGHGLWQVVGNVWEWCADRYDAGYYAVSATTDPRGPDSGAERVLRGGSYLCHDSYCNRYRVAARSGNTPDSAMGNAGFRTVAMS